MIYTFFSDIAPGDAAEAGAKHPRTSTITRVSTKPISPESQGEPVDLLSLARGNSPGNASDASSSSESRTRSL